MWIDLLDKYLYGMPEDLYYKTKRYNIGGIERGNAIIEKLLFNVKGMKVLDYGCGSGGIAIAFARSGAVVTAIEPNAKLREMADWRAWEDGAKINFMVHGNFDLIILNDVLEHVQEPRRTIFECRNMLEPKGLLYISTPNKWSPKQILHEEHSGLALISLMPRKMAEWYVCKVRKRAKTYTVNKIHSYREIVQLFAQNNLGYIQLDERKPLQKLHLNIKVATELVCHTFRPGNFGFLAWRK